MLKFMKSLPLFIVLLFTSFQYIHAFELKDSLNKYTFEIPGDYKIEYQATEYNTETLRAIIVNKDFKISFYYFYPSSGKNFDVAKMKEISDSVFFSGLESAIMYEREEGEKYDVANSYKIIQGDKFPYFQKYYRYIHSNGICIVKATSLLEDFAQINSIANSYNRSAFWWGLLGFLILCIIPAILIDKGLDYRKNNLPKTIVFVCIGILCSLVSLIWFDWWAPILIILLSFAARAGIIYI